MAPLMREKVCIHSWETQMRKLRNDVAPLCKSAQKLLVLMLVVGVAQSAFAQAGRYPGEKLLSFAASYLIAPLGIFAIVIALAGRFFRPDLVKGAIYAALICAVLYF